MMQRGLNVQLAVQRGPTASKHFLPSCYSSVVLLIFSFVTGRKFRAVNICCEQYTVDTGIMPSLRTAETAGRGEAQAVSHHGV